MIGFFVGKWFDWMKLAKLTASASRLVYQSFRNRTCEDVATSLGLLSGLTLIGVGIGNSRLWLLMAEKQLQTAEERARRRVTILAIIQ